MFRQVIMAHLTSRELHCDVMKTHCFLSGWQVFPVKSSNIENVSLSLASLKFNLNWILFTVKLLDCIIFNIAKNYLKDT